jgi:hypothetical protein
MGMCGILLITAYKKLSRCVGLNPSLIITSGEILLRREMMSGLK